MRQTAVEMAISLGVVVLWGASATTIVVGVQAWLGFVPAAVVGVTVVYASLVLTAWVTERADK